jgi:hypothetical protein
MKAEFDKEMDSLLRQSARRGRRSASGETDAPAAVGVHLDADEQSAYAENALPAAARAHYIAHLADCDDCRHRVTQLALAAGTAGQLEAREALATGQRISPHVAWRERLGALFAPRAWRYAVPALALVLVGAISFIVFTRKPESETSIAQRDVQKVQRPQATTQPEAHHAPQNGNLATTNAPVAEGAAATTSSDPNATATNPNAAPAKEEIAANSQRTGAAQAPAPASLNDAAAPPPAAPATGGGVGARSVSELPTPALIPAPVADAVTVTSEQEAKIKSGESAPELRRLEQRSVELENRQYENRQREQLSGPRRNEQVQNRRAPVANQSNDRADKRDEDLAAATTAAPASPATAAGRARQQRAAERGKDENRPATDAEGDARAAKPAAETRTVAGRRFRRQGDAWVDMAYTAGQSYTVVRRNSEQFRSLAADEPQLRRIADALGGEVTVVWKGRAYRIR